MENRAFNLEGVEAPDRAVAQVDHLRSQANTWNI